MSFLFRSPPWLITERWVIVGSGQCPKSSAHTSSASPAVLKSSLRTFWLLFARLLRVRAWLRMEFSSYNSISQTACLFKNFRWLTPYINDWLTLAEFQIIITRDYPELAVSVLPSPCREWKCHGYLGLVGRLFNFHGRNISGDLTLDLGMLNNQLAWVCPFKEWVQKGKQVLGRSMINGDRITYPDGILEC